jgi:bacteriocin biosynthesis cyclodehydratase domain-containing protein
LLVDVSAGDADAAPEEPIDIFYWHFGKSRADIEQGIAGSKLVVMGVNCVSRQLVTALAAAGIASVDVVDYPLLGNVRLFDEDGVLLDEAWPRGGRPPLGYREWLARDGARGAGCIVATSDFGGQHLLRQWNGHCVRERVHFLPVVLQDLVGHVGPLVIPGESACLECVRARENSHMTDAETRRAAEYVAYAGQVVNGFHPSMASILGDIAAIEIMKLYGHIMRSRLVGRMLEVNLLAPQITERRVLRVPRCTVCGTAMSRSPVSQDKGISMPGHEVLR